MKKIILGLGLALGLLTGSALAASSGSGGFAILAPAVDNTVIGNVTGVTGTPVAVDIGTALAHNAAGNRTALGLPLGTSGATVPLLSTANTWSLAQTFTAAPVLSALAGSGVRCVHVDNSGIPSVASGDCASGGSGSVTSITIGNGLTSTQSPITTVATLNLANVAAVSNQWVDSIAGNVLHLSQPAFSNLSGMPAANSLLLSAGSGSNPTGLAPGALNNCAVSNGTLWTSAACPGGGSGTVTVVGAGNLTANALVIGGGAQTESTLAAATNGQIPIGSTGAAPTIGAITASAPVVVTNGPGTIALSAPTAVTAASALTSNALIIGGGGQATSALAAGTDGQLVIGATAGPPTIRSVSGDGTLSATGVLAVTKVGGDANVAFLDVAQTFTKPQREQKATVTISTATFTPDFSAAPHFAITLVHASCPCTLANPTNLPAAGVVQEGVIEIKQSATGGDAITTYGTAYVTVGGTAGITLSSGANAVDYFPYHISDGATVVLGAALKSPTH